LGYRRHHGHPVRRPGPLAWQSSGNTWPPDIPRLIILVVTLCADTAKKQMPELDTGSGKVIASLPCTGDTDDVFFDSRHRRVYVSGGEGSVSVFQQADPDHYTLLATVPTAPGARTALFVAATGRLYVAVPHRGKQPAEIRECRTPEAVPKKHAGRAG
jgi:hypothetical protein